MRAHLLLLFLLTSSGSAVAEDMTNEVFGKVMTEMAMLSFWSKAPASLLLKCGTSYPDTTQSAQGEYLKWQTKNAAFTRIVEARLGQFIPGIAKLMGKTPDEWQVWATRHVDQELDEKFFQKVEDPKRHQLCGDFQRLLDAMLSDDLLKPRVNMALEELPKYLKYLPK